MSTERLHNWHDASRAEMGMRVVACLLVLSALSCPALGEETQGAAGDTIFRAHLAEFLASRFGETPAVGDRTRFGAVELIVRDVQGDTITQVGVELEPAPVHPWRLWLRRFRRSQT